jgi:hypothetical protein
MRRFIFIHLFFISFYCFAQQNLPERIIGNIPDGKSTKLYQVQVGAYTVKKNADNAVSSLRKHNLNPDTEVFKIYTRVLIKKIPANQVINYLTTVRQAGFREVIIREDINLSAAKVELDNLIYRTWKIANCPDAEFIGYLAFVSKEGLCVITPPDGGSSVLFAWRWYNDQRDGFEYSYDGMYYSRAKIAELTVNSLKVSDTEYDLPSAGAANQWELVPYNY